MLDKNSKIVICSSAGGHFTELLLAIGNNFDNCSKFMLSYQDLEIQDTSFIYLINPEKNLFKYFINFFQSFMKILKLRPDVFISAGAGIAIFPLIFSRLIGSKIIFIESLAYITKPTFSGRFCYWFSHLFIVQSEELLDYFPKAKLGRLL